MKGTILLCLEEAIISRFGEEDWSNCISSAGYDRDYSFGKRIKDNIDENESIALFMKSAEVLNIDLKELFDLFGEYWCCTYAPSVYGVFYVGFMSTKKAITKLDWVHDRVTQSIADAKPPRFVLDWIDDDKVLLKYQSNRALIDLLISLIKGLNKKFNDSTIITKLSETELELVFLDSPGKTEVIYA